MYQSLRTQIVSTLKRSTRTLKNRSSSFSWRECWFFYGAWSLSLEVKYLALVLIFNMSIKRRITFVGLPARALVRSFCWALWERIRSVSQVFHLFSNIIMENNFRSLKKDSQLSYIQFWFFFLDKQEASFKVLTDCLSRLC